MAASVAEIKGNVFLRHTNHSETLNPLWFEAYDGNMIDTDPVQ